MSICGVAEYFLPGIFMYIVHVHLSRIRMHVNLNACVYHKHFICVRTSEVQSFNIEMI